MKEKIFIFLDIDGVFNSLENIILNNFTNEIEPIYIKRFNYLIKTLCMHYDVSIIISSSWRLIHTLLEIQTFFTDSGFEYVSLITDTTSYIVNGIRGEEINNYVTKNNINKYIIIDDNNDVLELQYKNFLQTNFLEGLTFKDCIKILKHFNIKLDYDLDYHTFKFNTKGI